MKKILAVILALALVTPLLAVSASAEGNPSTWLSDETVTITVMRDDSPQQPLRLDATKRVYIKDLLNVDLVIEAPPKADYADKKGTLIATDSMPDIMLVDAEDVKQYARDDMFVNLSEHRDELPNLFALLDQNETFNLLTVDGDFYHAPVLQRIGPNFRRGGQFVMFRTDLLEKYGIATPTTWDELLDAVVAIREKEPDMVGITNRKGGSITATRKMLDCMAYPLGSGSDMYYDEDMGGVWVYGPGNENFKAVLEWLNKAYAAGALDPDYAVMTKELWEEKLSANRAICTVDNNGVVANYNAALQTIDPSYKFGVIPTLTNTLGQTRNNYYDENWLTQAWVISSSSENIDVCLKFLNWCYSDQGADVNGFGIEGETFEYDETGYPQTKEEIMAQYADSGSNAAYEIQSALGVGLLDITPYVDAGLQYEMELYLLPDDATREEQKVANAALLSDEGLRAPVQTPPLTAEQTERYNELHVKVETAIYQEVDKYITGQEPIENYDAVIASVADDVAEMEAIYNEAWKAAIGE